MEQPCCLNFGRTAGMLMAQPRHIKLAISSENAADMDKVQCRRGDNTHSLVALTAR